MVLLKRHLLANIKLIYYFYSKCTLVLMGYVFSGQMYPLPLRPYVVEQYIEKKEAEQMFI